MNELGYYSIIAILYALRIAEHFESILEALSIGLSQRLFVLLVLCS